ncbi:WD40 repeat-containing protein [Cavenderia fasciculata]|uniref:WD40 repeat-containing protein n=1 Tax=Cavenderia fasciculata TaxID=261658 RepID=F4QDR3_CACFS|nr:WD40 repeat-containing protein [Cavenderia fasciculata]EGG13860.1 WD40 repeat-containing protein [Cavenderia fasciculata]|eukprot:XP_004350568.1 WD40 repeat-containing protein [Cavenderia fasciculata]
MACVSSKIDFLQQHTFMMALLPPSDGVTSLNYCPSSNLLLASSWDTTVRCYDTTNNSYKWQYSHECAVLDACYPERNRVYSGDIDGKIKSFDPTVGASSERVVGAHDKGAKSVIYNAEGGCLYSGSWDTTVRVWDTRSNNNQQVSSHSVEAQVFSMAYASVTNMLVVGTADKMVTIFDTRQMDTPFQKRESSIKYQTRCIRTFIDGSGYALASVEGRIGMEYFDPKVQQAKKYAFKCHRATENSVDVVYPVNSIAFHPIYGTFATGGCDGNVYFWDGQNRKRLYHLRHYPTSISTMAFNSDGTQLAVASSYTYEEGEKDHPNDQIYIHVVNDKIKPFEKPAK